MSPTSDFNIIHGKQKWINQITNSSKSHHTQARNHNAQNKTAHLRFVKWNK